MYRLISCFLFVLGVGLAGGQGAHAQAGEAAPGDTVRVVLDDGAAYVGVIEGETEAELTLVTLAGVQMAIPRARIASVDVLEGGRYRPLDPNRSRLLFAPTARPLDAGSGYVAAYELFFPFVGYGITDRIILAGGVSLIPGLSGQLVYLAPKVTFYQQEQVSLAGGVLVNTFVGDFDDDDVPVFGLVYAVGTFGRPGAAVSGGMAFGYADGAFSGKPAVMLGGEYQLSSHVKLLTENYVFVGVDEGMLLSGAIRFFGDTLAADLGLITTPVAFDEGGFPFLPWLGFAYNF